MRGGFKILDSDQGTAGKAVTHLGKARL